MITVDEIRGIDLFEGLTDEELGAWVAVCAERVLAPGDVLVSEGETTTEFSLLLSGALDGLRTREGVAEVDHQHRAPTWLGAIPLLTEAPTGVTIRAAEPSRLAVIGGDAFRELIHTQRPVFRRIMQRFRPVISRIDSADARREKLASLGTMAAGLAHELNNPAAAARRSAEQLAQALVDISGALHTFVSSGVEREQAEVLAALHDQAVSRAHACTIADRSPLAVADREERLLELLEDAGVGEAYKLAEPLAAAGVDADWLQQVAAQANGATEAAVKWVAASLTADALVDELRESTVRMSSLVGAMKTYAYMDQGALVEVDVREGLEATLTILGHKLKQTSITVTRAYADGLPAVCVYGSELNQVWTNLLDNAISALGETGEITITTSPWEDRGVEVVIADDGPGIPAELQRQVFDPFFTTKPVGEGTGLGLDTARRIVEDRHLGRMTLESEPGRTAFTVRLPHAPRKA